MGETAKLESMQWEARPEGDVLRVELRGLFDERTDFSVIELGGYREVVFDVSGITRINSWGARQWILFLRTLPVDLRYQFVDASIEFVKHCNMIADMVGRGRITSFYAPYACDPCRLETERRLETRSLSRAALREAPVFTCPACGGDEVLDDFPRRYFAFLPL